MADAAHRYLRQKRHRIILTHSYLVHKNVDYFQPMLVCHTAAAFNTGSYVAWHLATRALTEKRMIRTNPAS